jgi:hypothetical protein
VELEEDVYRFFGWSGSLYLCNKSDYGFSDSYTESVLNNILATADKHGVSMEVLPEDTDFLTLIQE